jgi:hypothetical protein
MRTILHELGHNFGLNHSANDILDPMGGINHSHYNVPNMMKLGFDFNVKDMNDLGKGRSTEVDLKPIETNLDAAERGGVYLYGTSLKRVRAEADGTLPASKIPLPLPSGTLLPVIVKRESNGSATSLAVGDPRDRNWKFTYGDTSYAWHPTITNRIVVTRSR